MRICCRLLRELGSGQKGIRSTSRRPFSLCAKRGMVWFRRRTDELTLQEPEIIGKGGRFGVQAYGPARRVLHLIRVDIQTEVSPVVGTEQQSEEMLRYFMEGFEQDPQKLWQSNLFFGKPLSDLVQGRVGEQTDAHAGGYAAQGAADAGKNHQ